ncbi:aminoglycoside phosphotransferase family protein [Nocardiopsis sp. EMB25]|uniref:phosphotransferase n=1 Tax=Nocardiopsis sp. EMB25 TaxID=2835867 RepID=UPI00228405E4|nr:phosphotransferase [Nocardiopsis sp. EMB25]MCY9787133.1 aminoglycoside phosphotransferase family protein [Nocardiopsis sp. EMB25]
MSAAVPRLGWDQLPAHLRQTFTTDMGGSVTDEHRQSGGFSPGMASRLTLSNGRRVFVKAIHPDRDPRAVELYRREIRIAAALPAGLPAPELLWTYDQDDWVALAFADIDGRHPAEPWGTDDLDRVVDALAVLADQLTPSPVATVSLIEDLAENFSSWRRLAATPRAPELDQLPAWAHQNLDLLAHLEAGWEKGASGATLVHSDLRADNLLLTPERVWVIDWPYAATGAAYMDLLLLLPSVAAGGVDPEPVWRRYGPANEADADSVNAVLAAIAGDHLTQSQRPAPPNIPTLRAHQRAKGEAALAWLRTRLKDG